MNNYQELAEHYQKAEKLIEKLHNLSCKDLNESAEADEIRDQLDVHWYALPQEYCDLLAQYSATLIRIEDGSQKIPQTCCKNVGNDGFISCDKPAITWYIHGRDVCSFCKDHDYQCGTKYTPVKL